MDIINSQHQDERDLAIKVLAWIVLSKRPMTAPEMLHALAAEVDVADLDEDNIPELQKVISVCCGPVTVETETSIVRWFTIPCKNSSKGAGRID